MATLLDQPARERAHRIRAEAAAVMLGVERHVDAGRAIVGVGLLAVADQADDPAVELDHEPRALIVMREVAQDPLAIEAPPPLHDAGLRQDLGQPVGIALREGFAA